MSLKLEAHPNLIATRSVSSSSVLTWLQRCRISKGQRAFCSSLMRSLGFLWSLKVSTHCRQSLWLTTFWKIRIKPQSIYKTALSRRLLRLTCCRVLLTKTDTTTIQLGRSLSVQTIVRAVLWTTITTWACHFQISSRLLRTTKPAAASSRAPQASSTRKDFSLKSRTLTMQRKTMKL